MNVPEFLKVPVPPGRDRQAGVMRQPARQGPAVRGGYAVYVI